jgi:hypothetical protein
MKRGLVSAVAAAGMAIGGVALSAPAHALPTQGYVNYSAGVTSAWYTSGTGYIRAKQYCESSSGQTNWWVYGSWVGKNIYSVTSHCYYVRDFGFEVKN